MNKFLSIIISTARKSDAFVYNHPEKHLFQDLFESIEAQRSYHKDIELIIVDELFQKRNLKSEMESLKKWSFDYKIIPAKDSFWKTHKLFHVNSSFNTGFTHSNGEYLFILSDTASFPDGFFKKYFHYISLGYCPHSIYIYNYNKNLLVREENLKIFKEICPNVKHEKVFDPNSGMLYSVDCNYNNLLLNKFFESHRFSEIFISDGRVDNLFFKDPNVFFEIDGKRAVKLYSSWYHGTLTIRRNDYLSLNGYSEHFDGFKGLCDCEIGPRYFNLKNIEHSMQNDHIIVEDLFTFEGLQKPYDPETVELVFSFIDPSKLYEYFNKIKSIKANFDPIPDEELDKIFLKPRNEFDILCQDYYRNNQPNFDLNKMLMG